MLDLRDYDPDGWQSALDAGAWTQAELDEGISVLRDRRLTELRELALVSAEALNPMLSHPVAIELLKMLQPVISPELTPELQAAANLLGTYELARMDIESMTGEELYNLDVRAGWYG